MVKSETIVITEEEKALIKKRVEVATREDKGHTKKLSN